MKAIKFFKTSIKFLFICALVLLASCKKKPAAEEEMPTCSCPHCVIYIQPYENFTKEEVNAILPDLQKNFDKWLYGGWEFKVLDPKPLPAESYVKNRDRYKAKVILDSLNKFPLTGIDKNIIFMGLTHKDICANVHGMDNYGIIGYSYSPGQVSVVSDKRIKTKSMVWKPMLHEFIHAFYGAKHCPKDDKKCFMVDFKGKGNIEMQEWLCDACKH